MAMFNVDNTDNVYDYDYDYKLNNIQHSRICEDEQLAKIIRIARAFKNNNAIVLIRYISQFRMEYPDFEFDTEINIARMHLSVNKIEKADEIIKRIRNTLFLKLVGIQYIKNRIDTNKDIGDLDIIPLDVLKNLIIIT